MPALATDLRRELERTVIKARDVAEVGARQALEALTVHEGKPGGHLDPAGRALRNRLRAHGRQLGDVRQQGARQTIDRLVNEAAYEHWHRMLFARYLAENDLLVEPESGVAVTLDEVEELARDEGINPWALAARYAQGALPQIFRTDDPVLAVELPPEARLQLEELLEALPPATFTADDSLGWVYQFWQAEEKKRVNDSGEKITGETLPAVTQLFTEHYMVLFLLHNTLGAWHAGKTISADDFANATSEDELRDKAALRTAAGDSPWSYLRFVRDPEDGPWRPASGTFEGWPREAKDLRVLDPCCGSGHFLVAAFKLLVRLRMYEEGLGVRDAVTAVLRDNLFGLELDARCVQLAAFNVALAAWTLVGERIELPELHLACCGIGPSATEEEWIELAEQSGVPAPRGGWGPIRIGLGSLHHVFSQAPTLGSLIDPTQLTEVGAADHETLLPYLDAVMQKEESGHEFRERAIAAAGMVKAAELLAGSYTLVVTNVPYLGRGQQDPVLKEFCEKHYGHEKADLATVFVSRMLRWVGAQSDAGAIAAVTPQNWLFLSRYKKLREKLLSQRTWNSVARLGPGSFETISGHVVNVALLILSGMRPSKGIGTAGIDASTVRAARSKALLLRGEPSKAESDSEGVVQLVLQSDHRKNPDARITLIAYDETPLLSEHAFTATGQQTFDSERFWLAFWELQDLSGNTWTPAQSTVSETTCYSGRSIVLRWEDGEGQLFDLMKAKEAEGYTSGIWRAGTQFWKQRGVLVSLAGKIKCCIYDGVSFDNNTGAVVPKHDDHLCAIWCFCSSDEFVDSVRGIDQKLNVTNATLAKVSFDLRYWQKVAAERYPAGLPAPKSNEPTQWLFHGRPEYSDEATVLQVGVARLLGYCWPPEIASEMHLAAEARTLAESCEELERHADSDGLVCLSALRNEATAADRLRRLLSDAYGNPWTADLELELLAAAGSPGVSLEDWLRDAFFEQHCKLFHHRPFVWHVWDGRRDGFHALVNYHKLAAPDGEGRKLLDTLTYSYLGDWITRQQAGVKAEEPGAEPRLAAALVLKAELEKILAGEPPYDLFVRWKPLHEQPIGWVPDINDGVRLNIRPFLKAKDVGRKGTGILRFKPNCKWTKDRGKEPQKLRPREDYPWFWSWDEKTQDFTGTETFDGNRWNDLHYTTAAKQAARDAASQANKEQA